ncbi:hypothetical protein MRB53_011141 [Persea americana]|uniref:Uncharacterized protein n=1 Tax=Persea americana TaxID=3435 RepID=A0ACC2LU51_PERAE|nr:hypothetical protein MRB53_011141 [Persea americana]
MQEYLHQLKVIADQLATCGAPVNEEDLILYTLSGLPSMYRPFQTSIRTRYTMVPASLYLGFAASIIWVGQGTYLTSTARSHAKDCHLHEGTVIANFTGEFCGMFASTQVIGNLISLVLLKNGKVGKSMTGTTLLFSVFLGAEFTKNIVTPALGVSGVGGAMAAYGASDAICSWAAGRFTSGLSSITFIVSGGAFLQMVVLLWLLLKYSLTSGILGPVHPFLMVIIWGIGDGVFNTAECDTWNAFSGVTRRQHLHS